VPTSSIIDLASTPGLKMVLLPITGPPGEKISKGNPGVFHNTVFAKGSYRGVESDVPTVAITAVLMAMENFPADRLYQILSAIFANRDALAAVWKDATKLTPQMAISQIEPSAIKYLHPGARKFFQEKGAVK